MDDASQDFRWTSSTQHESSQPAKGKIDYDPVIEEPVTRQHECLVNDIEDVFHESCEDIPTLSRHLEKLKMKLDSYMEEKDLMVQDRYTSNALGVLSGRACSIPAPPKLKKVDHFRAEHDV